MKVNQKYLAWLQPHNLYVLESLPQHPGSGLRRHLLPCLVSNIVDSNLACKVLRQLLQLSRFGSVLTSAGNDPPVDFVFKAQPKKYKKLEAVDAELVGATVAGDDEVPDRPGQH